MTLPICPHCKQVVRRKFGDVVPACIDCGSPLPNARFQRCPDCRRERRKETYRASHARRYAANPRKFINYQKAWKARKKAAA